MGMNMIRLDEGFYKEEILCGFRVTEKRKKCWSVLLNMLQEFDTFAKEFSLQYFVGFGTLLGAVRHNGFIPWDDDIDIVMKRDEYMRMEGYARDYFNGRELRGRRLLYEDAYNDEAVIKSYFSKIRDLRTTIAEPSMRKNGVFSGISIDIFPLDAVSDGTNELAIKSRMRAELWLCFIHGVNYKKIFNELFNGQSILKDELLFRISNLPMKERFRMFEDFSLSMWGKSNIVGDLIENLNLNGKRDNDLSWWQEEKYLPFENLMVPVPSGWNNVLSAEYGDYKEYVKGGSAHENSFYDPDTPFSEYQNGNIKIPDDWRGEL